MGETRTTEPVVHLVLAGLGNSSYGHWQRAWAQLLPSAVWLQHASWIEPNEQQWLADLDDFLARESRPVVVVAHSLGCSLLASWVDRHHDDEAALAQVRAALLVAPPDTTRPDFPPEIHGFDQVQYRTLPFPATVVYSTNDPYSSSERALETAAALGADAVNLGDAGHINSATALGAWPQGQAVLGDLKRRAGLPAKFAATR